VLIAQDIDSPLPLLVSGSAQDPDGVDDVPRLEERATAGLSGRSQPGDRAPAIFSPFSASKSCTDEAAPSGSRNRGNVYVSILPASARTSLRAHDRQSSRNAACSRDSRIQTMSWARRRNARPRRWSSYPCGSGRWRA